VGDWEKEKEIQNRRRRGEIKRGGVEEQDKSGAVFVFLRFAASEMQSNLMMDALLLMQAVVLSNPKTADFEICRPSLLPGMMKTMGNGQKMPKPIKLFEITDVVLKDSEVPKL
jgi:phenylalanyl-tRNA synthetase beta subunit